MTRRQTGILAEVYKKKTGHTAMLLFCQVTTNFRNYLITTYMHQSTASSLPAKIATSPGSSLKGCLPGGTFVPQQQKFHTDDVNQCLHNKSYSHGVPNVNLFDFLILLDDYGKVLSSAANKLQPNSNASAKEEYIPRILTVIK